jgi:hypothetical protein
MIAPRALGWVKAQGCRVRTFPKMSGQMRPSISSEALSLGICPPDPRAVIWTDDMCGIICLNSHGNLST